MLVALFGYACRYQPSCSEYARTAIAEHGLMRGGAMALARLARCHPLGGHGYDPPPRPASAPAPHHGRF
jgi:putative membrane protein insertion efficiency factor